MLNKTLLLFFVSILSVCNLYAQKSANEISVSFNTGVGNTNFKRLANLYLLATPRIGLRKNNIMYGVEANRYHVKSSFRVHDVGVFARFYTRSRLISFVETKITHGVIKSEGRSTYYALTVSPGWQWQLKSVENLSIYAMIDFYHRDRQLQQQAVNFTPRVGLEYKL